MKRRCTFPSDRVPPSGPPPLPTSLSLSSASLFHCWERGIIPTNEKRIGREPELIPRGPDAVREHEADFNRFTVRKGKELESEALSKGFRVHLEGGREESASLVIFTGALVN